jgi:cell wall-associated NlpC family hydrolase
LTDVQLDPSVFPKHGRHLLPKEERPQVPSAFWRRSSGVRHGAVIAFSAAIVATLALPAYSFAPEAAYAATEPLPAVDAQPAVEVQNVVVAADAKAPEAQRDEFSATTVAELEAKREKERAEKRAKELAAQRERDAAEAREERAAEEAAAEGSGTNSAPEAAAPSAEQPAAPKAAAAAPAASASGGSIVDVARQYLGVPYVFGGASPSGFDCSGLVMYVYGQFGISLPHSSSAQGANGTQVAASDAKPGDLVVIDGGSHIGIYTGGGNMIDAPMPGRVVNERPIYTTNYYFVRY